MMTRRETYSILGLDEGVVDSNNLDIVMLDAVRCVSTGECVAFGRGSRIAVDLKPKSVENVRDMLMAGEN